MKTDLVTELQSYGDKFTQAMTGDLKWVLIALIALTLGAMYACSVGVVEAESKKESEW